MTRRRIEVGVNMAAINYLRPRRGHLFATPLQLANRAREIGFNLCIGLPFWGADGYSEPADFMRFYEDAWNPTTFMGFIKKTWGEEGPAHLHDFLLFPSPAECARISRIWADRGIAEIHHDFKQTQQTCAQWQDRGIAKICDDFSSELVEVSPRLDMGPVDILFRCQKKGHRLVVDTRHLQRRYRKDEILVDPERAGRPSPLGTNIGHWLYALDIWQEVLAPVMHLNVDAQNFLNDQELVSVELLKHWLLLTGKHKCRMIILEYHPGKAALFSDWSQRLAVAMLKKTRNLLDDFNL